MLNEDNSGDIMTIVLPDVKSFILEEFLSQVFFASDEDAIIDASLKHLGFGSSMDLNESFSDEILEVTLEENEVEDYSKSDEISQWDSENQEQLGSCDENVTLKRFF